jgi:ubiquitin carboxyl-terminal hydrolase 5/13
MNSVIQVLFSLESFQSKYFDSAMEHLQVCKKKPSECYLCQLSKVMFGLLSGNYSEEKSRNLPLNKDKEQEVEVYQDGIYLNSFKSFFAQNNRDFLSNKQQDATEYLFHIMEIFEVNNLIY